MLLLIIFNMMCCFSLESSISCPYKCVHSLRLSTFGGLGYSYILAAFPPVHDCGYAKSLCLLYDGSISVIHVQYSIFTSQRVVRVAIT